MLLGVVYTFPNYELIWKLHHQISERHRIDDSWHQLPSHRELNFEIINKLQQANIGPIAESDIVCVTLIDGAHQLLIDRKLIFQPDFLSEWQYFLSSPKSVFIPPPIFCPSQLKTCLARSFNAFLTASWDFFSISSLYHLSRQLKLLSFCFCVWLKIRGIQRLHFRKNSRSESLLTAKNKDRYRKVPKSLTSPSGGTMTE